MPQITDSRAVKNDDEAGQAEAGDDEPETIAFPAESQEKAREAPVGFEPTMADLQSAALATWPQRLRCAET